MANLKTVQVPAEVKLQVTNQTQVMRNLYKDFQDIFASVDPGSAFGKSIAKAFSKVESKLSASEGLLSGEFFSEADLRKVASQLSSISELFGQINIQARGVSASTLGLDTTEIDNAEKHLRQLQDRVRELKKAKVGTLLGADSKDLQAFAKLSSTTGFSGGKSYADNYKSMEAAIGRITEKYGQLTTEAQAAEEAARQANEEVAKARVNLNMAEGQLANRKQANLNAANQIMGVKVSGKGATRDSITEQYLAMLDSQLDQGQWVAGGENFAHIIAGWLEVDEADLAGTATDIVNNLKNAIRTAMAGGPIASNKLRASAKSVLGGEEAALRKDAGYVELEQKVQTSTTYVQGAEIAADEALTTLQAANNTVEQTRQLLEQIQIQMARLKELQDEYNAAVDAQHREQIDAARQGVSTAKANTKAGTLNATEEAAKTAGRAVQNVQNNSNNVQIAREADEAKAKADALMDKESEQFTANLKAAIARWMSAQQIINMVKQGIRQAYQDIQGLDKAMTNIAVVTDMSVGDLWGKINEYMSIAQQYGVTTQGVYEVSQLYYQQGLSTSDVMAATTETLKMARIAGMDYAEAADAMTVAIRAFKMEMSDAQHITDVYSKVAAVTASDTEELAIAMSKTASSAESVGSSFENTTAMLAVMIETTRESAQNLGSALKSIISRYGEMKVGLTVDSEGEEIDYNKVDTALKSVGISIKDAQGQFRDFDDVIFELSEKWDSLDKNTQRYIATIMAGNRQQSRFIALVDNWERLDEVSLAAQDSEDAGLIQYAKTLDSLETKLNNIKTSFQQFYMSIFNGPFVSSILDFINNIIQGFNKLGQWQSILNIAGLIRSIKSIAKLLVSSISPTFNVIIQDFKKAMKEMVEIARRSGRESGEAFSSGMANTNNPEVQQSFFDRRMIGDSSGKIDLSANSWNGSKAGNIVSIVGQVVGSIASMVGSSVAADNQRAGAVISGLGNVAQGASIGAMAGPWGAIIGGIIGALTSLPAIFEAFDPANILAEKLEKAEETLEQANLERATKREEARNLATTLENLKKLQQARYKSEEAEQAYIEASNAAFEAYPELTATFDEAGNAIIDVIGNASEAEWLLIQARKEAAEATQDAAAAELSRNLVKLEQAEDKVDSYGDFGDQAYPVIVSSTWYDFDENGREIGMAPINNVGRLLATLLNIDASDTSKDADWFQEMLMSTFNFDLSQYEGATQAEAVKTVIDLIRNHPDIFNSFKNSEDNNYGLETYDTAEDLIWLMTTWLRDRGVIDKDESALDYYGHANTANEEYNQAQVAVNNSMLAVGRGRVGKLLTNIDPLGQADWRNITNAEAFLQESVVAAANLTAADFNNDGTLKTDAINRLDQIFLDTYENYINFANELGYDLDDFNAILVSADKNLLSQQGITKEFENLFGTDHNQWSEVVVQYYDFLMQGVSEAQERFKKNLTSNRLFSRWSSYTTEVPAFENVLQELPSAYFAYISDFADSIDKRIESGSLTQDQAFQVVDTLFNVLDSLNDPALGLTSEQLGTAYQLISEAMSDGSIFTITGLQGLITTLTGLGIDVDAIGLSDLPIYTTNLVTEWGNLQDTLVSNLNIASEAMQKASEGMTLDEALKLAQKTGMDWSDFTFIDGKWYTSNIEAIKTYYEDEQKRIIAQLEEEKKRLLGTSDQAGTLDTGLSAEDLNIIKGLSLEEFQEVYSIEYGDNPEVWQAIQTYWDPEHYAQEAAKHVGDDSWGMAQYWEEYFNSLGQNVSAATQEALTYYAEQSEKAAKKAEFVASLNKSAKSKGVVMDKVSAYQTIASQGLLGYSTEDIASIAMAMDWQEGVQFELDTTTGTYRIKKEYLSELPAEYQRQVDSVLRAETESALSSIRTLGSSLANGEVGVYADAFIKTLPDAETIIPALIKAGDYEGLKAKIAAELSARTGEEVAIDDPRVVKAANEMVAGYNDGLESNVLRYIELKKKELFGTITEAEKLELGNIVDTGELSDELTSAFANAGTTAVGKYVAVMKAAMASGADWEEVEQYIKDGYAAQLAQLASGQNFNNLDTYDIMDQVAEAEGQYSQDMLASLFSQIYAETGKKVDMSDFTQYFEIDPETKNWVLKAGANVNDFFASEYGTNVPDWITDAFGTSEAQKRVNDAVKLDDLGTSATDTIGSMMSDLTNTSLSDLISLYESIYGEGSFAESGLLEGYQAAVEAAKRGETQALITILQILTQAAIDAGADVDTTQIQSVTKDAHNTLVSGLITSITNGLSGTLSNVDFDKLIEQIGGAPEAYRQYVTETYDGLKLSMDGALVLASELVDKFGNSDAVVQDLIDQFGGSGLLGSYKDVDKLIKEAEADTERWGDQHEEVLAILYKIKGEYMQMADDEAFDIFNYDRHDGKLDNYYQFADSIKEVSKALDEAFKGNTKLTVEQFNHLFDWIEDYNPEGATVKLGQTTVTLQEFRKAIEETKKAGQVDLHAAAAKLGVGFDDMASAIEGGIQDIAKEQISYWTKYLHFLEGIQKLQEVSDQLTIEPPKINADGTAIWNDQLYEDANAAYAAYIQHVHGLFESTGIDQFMGKNNPIQQLWTYMGRPGEVDYSKLDAEFIQQVSNMAKWFSQYSPAEIESMFGSEGMINIPFEQFVNVSSDDSTTSVEEPITPIQESVIKTIESWGFKKDASGQYVYELEGIKMAVALGADGSVSLDLTTAGGTPPTADQMKAVFEGKQGFSADAAGNWTFTDSATGITYKCTNGKVEIDGTNFKAPPEKLTATDLGNILGTVWTSKDNGKTYTTTLDGVTFSYNAETQALEIKAPSGYTQDSLSDYLVQQGWQETEAGSGIYTWAKGNAVFTYNAETSQLTVKAPQIETDNPDTEFAQQGWQKDSQSGAYSPTAGTFVFTYGSKTNPLTIALPLLNNGDIGAYLLENGWAKQEGSSIYTWSDGNGLVFSYNSETQALNVALPEVNNGDLDELLKTYNWIKGKDGTYTYTTKNGLVFNYNPTTNSIQIGTPSDVEEPTDAEFLALLTKKGWKQDGTTYTKELPNGTIIYNAKTGGLTISTPSSLEPSDPEIAELLNAAFGEGAWQEGANGGYEIINPITGEILYTLPAKVTVSPTSGSNISVDDNGNLVAGAEVTLTTDTTPIDDALAGYEGKTINLNIGMSRGGSSTIRENEYFKEAFVQLRKGQTGSHGLFGWGEGANRDAAVKAFNDIVSGIQLESDAGILSSEDVALVEQLGIALNTYYGEGTVDLSFLGDLQVADPTSLESLTAFATAFGGTNIFANLTALINLLTAISNPELATLDLTNFISQIESMGELELDDEEINLVAAAAQALADALLPLKDASINPTVSVNTATARTNLDNLKKVYDAIKSKTVTVTVETEYNNGNNGGDGGDDGDENPGTPTDADYAGNVSGLALAKGNATDKLLAGARLAGKTLVGELGPELAVYDNQYHLLGRNGAEFVDLPSDAIVFNHRQTAGIIKGQAGYRGRAFVNGNVSGPALAGGDVSAAIASVKQIIAAWEDILGSSLSDMLDSSSSGGGGSGNTIKAVTEELQEWYNLSRQIEHIEQEINNLIAERANLLESDGAAYLRSLREEQALLRDQVATQEVLLEYQQLQLKRQADQINQNDIWSKFLEVDENGLLQYKNGNEANGGKGALDVLQGLNEMSGEEQIEYLKKIGYSYTTADGEKLEGEDLVKQFFQEFQDQIDSYDSLYDTVHQTEEKLQQLATSIEEINNEIKENQMDLEQEIFDILVEAWEAEIEALEEQKELIEDANEAYINGLNEALQTEREMYSDNERLADREQLQRQLSLLRRSGGSASEIASLEEQLDSMLKEEYFSKQEQMIQNISDANDEQIRLLEEQITLEQESLEYQKENGILWSKVYEIMSGSTDSILAFMQGNSPSFFAQSALQQEQMLIEWAKKVGIYTENRKYEEHESYAKEQVWDTGAIWSQNGMSGLKSTYDALDAQGKETVRNQFASAYASARVNGADHDTALQQAAAAVKQTLEGQQGAQEDEQNQVPTNTPDVSGSETWYVAGPGKLNLRKEASTNSKRLGQYGPGTAMKVLKKDGDWFKVEVDGKTGWVMSQYLTKTKPGTGSGTEQPNNSGSDLTHWTFTFNGTKYSHYKSKASAESKIQSLADGLDAKWAKNVEDGVMTRSEYARRKTGLSTLISNAKKTLASGKHSKGYSKGGLVDYTGLALVHGKPGQPEAFLNAKQTAMIAESVKFVGDGGALDGIRATLAALNSTIRSITNNNTTQTSSFTVAPGAVTIQVAQLNDSYDVEELSKDVMNRMVAIASKSTNRGVSRR